MKYLFSFILFILSYGLSAQTYIDKTTLDTIIVTSKQQSIVVKVSTVVTKDSTITLTVPVVTVKKYNQVPVPPPPPPPPPPVTGEIITLSFTPIPYSSADIVSPGRGAEQWHNGSAAVGNLPQPMDVYYRFLWSDIENTTQGSYNWTSFDNLVKTAINRKQKLSFGIMPMRTDGGSNVDGARLSYPRYLHTIFQSESTKDFIASGSWIPNYNSPTYLARLRALHEAVKNRLLTQRHNGVLFADAIYCIDIRGFGNWGEWHTDYLPWNSHPVAVRPTAAALKGIIDAHVQIFDRWPLVSMIAAFDGGMGSTNLFPPYPDVAYHALTAKNNWGVVGYRRDQWGATDSYLNRLMAGNTVVYNGVRLRDLILNKYKEAPITGEPMPASNNMADLLNQINTYHPTSIGNGNYGNTPTGTVLTRVLEGFKRTGYRIELKGGIVQTGDNKISITLNWQNVGIAPTYEEWQVLFELVSSSGSVVTLGSSSFKPKLFLPSTTPTVITDTFNESLSGTYTLILTVIDPSGYRSPLPIAINGRQANGSYNLGNIKI